MRRVVPGALVASLAWLTAAAGPALAASGWTTAVKSEPGVRIPKLFVTASDPAVAPGYIFSTPRTIYPGRTGPTIFDSAGHVVWFHRQSSRLSAQDLRPQIYGGKPVLTWSLRPPLAPEGATLVGGPSRNYNVIADSSYHIIKRVRARGRGVVTDGHDFVITSRNTALVLGARFLPGNLRRYHGPEKSGIIDDLVQEIDLNTGHVIFSWSAARHVSLADSYVRPPATGAWDVFHLNSVSVDSDGNLLVSARHTSTIYKVDRRTGKVIWRLGGKHSSFKLSAGAEFHYQHDALRQPDGTITLFDNEGTDVDHSHGQQSEAKRLRLNTTTKTAGLVAAFHHPGGGGIATSQGNTSLLPNGDVFVGWGISPWLSEYAPDGRLLFAAHYASVWHHSYRAFKAPWVGHPASSPAIAAVVGKGRVAAYASWNGATQVAQWQLLGGSAQNALTEIGRVPWADFETRMAFKTTPAFVQVKALDATGNVIGSSPVIAPKQG